MPRVCRDNLLRRWHGSTQAFGRSNSGRETKRASTIIVGNVATLMTAGQCRAARGLVGQSVRQDLRGKRGLVFRPSSTSRRAAAWLRQMQRVLEAAGVIFIKGGVKLKESSLG